jgi:hypothetical protein
MPLLAALALALVLAACTPLQWVKADANPEHFDKDMHDCQQEAWREASIHSWNYFPIGPTMFRDSLGRRFFAWPTGPFSDPFGDRFMEESRLAHFCMRSKGWQLVPAEKKAEKTM